MTWDLPQALVDWAQVVGAVLSLFAIVVALVALLRQRADIVVERRADHELELLRELTHFVASPDGYLEADVLVNMLPEGGPNIDNIRAILRRLKLDDEGTVSSVTDDERRRIWRSERKRILASIKTASDWRVSRIST